MDGRSLAEVFAWLRPDDLIWNYWVNNYLQGKTPPPFDILYWNADTTRMPAGLHRDFIEIAMANALAKPGAASMLGSPVDLSTIDTDSYVVGGISDCIVPWRSAYRATQLLGGKIRFVLSNGGHVASQVNPPTNPKASYRLAPANPPDHREWLAQAETVQGSWRPNYTSWLADRSGGRSNPRACWAARNTRRWIPHQVPTSFSGRRCGSAPGPAAERGTGLRSRRFRRPGTPRRLTPGPGTLGPPDCRQCWPPG